MTQRKRVLTSAREKETKCGSGPRDLLPSGRRKLDWQRMEASESGTDIHSASSWARWNILGPFSLCKFGAGLNEQARWLCCGGWTCEGLEEWGRLYDIVQGKIMVLKAVMTRKNDWVAYV